MTGGRPLVALLLGASAALAAVTAASAQPPDPSRMVLQRQDLPAGFAATGRRDRPNAAVAAETGVQLATLRGWGRIGGHEATYDREVDPQAPPRGPASVIAVVSIYRSATGLRKAFAASAARIGRDAAPKHEPMRLGARLGDAARLWKTRFQQDGVPVVLYTVVWRSRGALGYLSVAGVGGKLTPADVLALARRQQARIASTTTGTRPELVA